MSLRLGTVDVHIHAGDAQAAAAAEESSAGDEVTPSGSGKELDREVDGGRPAAGRQAGA